MIKKIITILFIASSFALLLLSKPVLAEENAANPYVSPAIINLSLKQGENQKSSYIYFNTTDADQKISIDIRAFQPSEGEHGTPLFADKDGNKVTSALSSWVKLEKNEYAVAKGDKAVVNFEVDAPKDAKTGKYFVAIFNLINDREVENGSLVKKEIGVTLVAEVTPAKAKETNQTFFNLDNLILYAGIAIIILAILLLLWMMIKRNKKSRNFFEVENKKAKKQLNKKTRK